MRISKQESIRRLYYFLFELYDITKNDYVKLNLIELTAKHKIGQISANTLVNNKIVLKQKHGKSNTYKWNSIRPNYKMVEKIHQKNLEKSRRYAEERKKLDVKSEPILVTTKTEIVKPKVEVKQKYFSFFWGLIKLNY